MDRSERDMMRRLARLTLALLWLGPCSAGANPSAPSRRLAGAAPILAGAPCSGG
jgi:hypothetical protein